MDSSSGKSKSQNRNSWNESGSDSQDLSYFIPETQISNYTKFPQYQHQYSQLIIQHSYDQFRLSQDFNPLPHYQRSIPETQFQYFPLEVSQFRDAQNDDQKNLAMNPFPSLKPRPQPIP